MTTGRGHNYDEKCARNPGNVTTEKASRNGTHYLIHCKSREPSMQKKYFGKWQITEMEQWDKDHIDTVVSDHLTVTKQGGEMEFGVVSF